MIRVPPAGQVDQVAVGPEPDHHPGPGGAEPELLPGHLHVPRRGNDPVELDRPAVPLRSWRPGREHRRGSPGLRLGRGALRPSRAGGSHRSTRSRCAAGTGANRSAGVTGTFSSSAWCGRSALYAPTQASTAAWASATEVNGPAMSRKSGRKVPWKRSTFPFWFGEAGAVSRWVMPLLAADLVEQHLAVPGAVPAEPVGELLAVVGVDLLRHPEPRQRLGQRQAHRPAGRPLDHLGDHAVAGVVIDRAPSVTPT